MENATRAWDLEFYRLDPITQERVIRLLAEIAERDAVAPMPVSHDAVLIRNTADTVLSLDAGGATDISERAPPWNRVAGMLQSPTI